MLKFTSDRLFCIDFMACDMKTKGIGHVMNQLQKDEVIALRDELLLKVGRTFFVKKNNDKENELITDIFIKAALLQMTEVGGADVATADIRRLNAENPHHLQVLLHVMLNANLHCKNTTSENLLYQYLSILMSEVAS